MIHWRNPLSLTALVIVPALVSFILLANRRRRQALTAFVASPLLSAVVPDLSLRRRALSRAALIGAMFCLVVALGGPMWGSPLDEAQREGIDLIVALDTSRSMLAADVKPNRLMHAKLIVRSILSELHGDRVGLVAFAGTAFVLCPLTLDYAAVTETLDAIEVGIIPEGKHQALFVISDGEDHEGDAEGAVDRASKRNITIYTVSVGTKEGGFVPGDSGDILKDESDRLVRSRVQERILKTIAFKTGGAYVRGSSDALSVLYRDYIGTLERRRLSTDLRERHLEDRFYLPLSLALLLLGLESLIGDRRPTIRAPRRRAAHP